MAMTSAERQKKRREKLKTEAKKSLLVRGEQGEFDERIRVALAVQYLASSKQIPMELVKLIAKTSENVFYTKDLSTKKFINKIVMEYLLKDKE